MFWLILAVSIWGFLHFLLASLKAKELAQRWFGEKLRRFYRLAYNLFAGVSFLVVLAIAVVTPDRKLYVVPLPRSGLMIAGEFLALIALVAGFRQTDVWQFLGLQQRMNDGKSGQLDSPVEAVRGHLVTSGMYRYVRHPLYSAGMVSIWLLPVMTVNALAINISLTVYVVVGAYFEERKLRHEFGREYADYEAITPMFIPFLKWNKKPQ